MGIRIIADSASDISQELAKEWNITVLPLKVRFGEEEFLDGVTLSNREFYERLIETDEIPKTSQITPFEYQSNFEKAVRVLLGVGLRIVVSPVTRVFFSPA